MTAPTRQRQAADALAQANAEWSGQIAQLRPLDDRKNADRLFWAAQRALRIERNPLGIGRKVEPGALDIERLVLAGALTTRVQEDWPHCAICVSRSACRDRDECRPVIF